jgi:hypothetical protein
MSGPAWTSSLIFVLSSWDDSHVPLCLTIGWDGGLTNFLSWQALNCDPTDLLLSSIQDYKCESLGPAYVVKNHLQTLQLFQTFSVTREQWMINADNIITEVLSPKDIC